MTLCTADHRLVVEDPIANQNDPKPKENPTPRRQKEVWQLAKQVVAMLLGALVLGALAAAFLRWWSKRDKPAPPPPPPVPPWVTALNELARVQESDWIAREMYSEHFARVSDIVRQYCGCALRFRRP